MAFQHWASLELVKQAEHDLFEDKSPMFCPLGTVPLPFSFVHSFSQSVSSIPAIYTLLAGSWEYGDGSGTALPLKSSQLSSWVKCCTSSTTWPPGAQQRGSDSAQGCIEGFLGEVSLETWVKALQVEGTACVKATDYSPALTCGVRGGEPGSLT